MAEIAELTHVQRFLIRELREAKNLSQLVRDEAADELQRLAKAVAELAPLALSDRAATGLYEDCREQCAKVAHEHREKGPWYGAELTIWRRACSQVEDAIRSLKPPGGAG